MGTNTMKGNSLGIQQTNQIGTRHAQNIGRFLGSQFLVDWYYGHRLACRQVPDDSDQDAINGFWQHYLLAVFSDECRMSVALD